MGGWVGGGGLIQQGSQPLGKSEKNIKMSFHFSYLREFVKSNKNQGKLSEFESDPEGFEVFSNVAYVCHVPCVQVETID